MKDLRYDNLLRLKINLGDPSDIYRPEKDVNKYRNYDIEAGCPKNVRNTYYHMHSNMTMEFMLKQQDLWMRFDKLKLTIMEALELLNNVVDESDPDTSLPNIVHAFQTAERIREKYPQQDWFHLIGLIHDLGKVMAFFGAEQWAVVGDTYPLGCEWSDKIVFGKKSFESNPDTSNTLYNSKLGIYLPNCGLNNVFMSWGHDEYMYQVLLYNKSLLPNIAQKIIRYHSFYPWHKEGEYAYLSNEDDIEVLNWVKKFNHFDLYSKSDQIPDIENLKPYYQSLIDKYIPGEIAF